MSSFHICFIEQNDIQEAAKVLSIAMLNNPHHIGVLLGNCEKERLQIENMFLNSSTACPALSFWQNQQNY